MWIELKRSARIDGTPRKPQWREAVPSRVAHQLIARGQARPVSGPHSGREGRGYPRRGWNLDAIDGVGDVTAREIRSAMDRLAIIRADRVAGLDPSDVPELDEDVLTALQDHLDARE